MSCNVAAAINSEAFSRIVMLSTFVRRAAKIAKLGNGIRNPSKLASQDY
jgi:hypothetical protein